jgi:hypothetical protein
MRRSPVTRTDRDPVLDTAVLHLARDAPDVTPVVPKLETVSSGMPWRVDAQPRSDAVALTGTVTAVRRDWRNQAGEPTQIMQLLVEQSLGDYRGYSGSPVLLVAPPAAIGVLVEQKALRTAVLGEVRAANVLLAAPIDRILARFDLTAVDVRLITTEPSKLLRTGRLERHIRLVHLSEPIDLQISRAGTFFPRLNLSVNGKVVSGFPLGGRTSYRHTFVARTKTGTHTFILSGYVPKVGSFTDLNFVRDFRTLDITVDGALTYSEAA